MTGEGFGGGSEVQGETVVGSGGGQEGGSEGQEGVRGTEGVWGEEGAGMVLVQGACRRKASGFRLPPRSSDEVNRRYSDQGYKNVGQPLRAARHTRIVCDLVPRVRIRSRELPRHPLPHRQASK